MDESGCHPHHRHLLFQWHPVGVPRRRARLVRLHGRAEPDEGASPLALPAARSGNVVLHVAVRGACHHFGCVAGLRHSVRQRRRTKPFLPLATRPARPVAFGIMPLFALANTCIALAPGWVPGLLLPDSLGIFFGLVLGKPLGIAPFHRCGHRTGLVRIAGGYALRPTGRGRLPRGHRLHHEHLHHLARLR